MHHDFAEEVGRLLHHTPLQIADKAKHDQDTTIQILKRAGSQ